RDFHPFFDWRVGDMRAELGAVAGSLDAEPQLAQPRDHVPLACGFGLGLGSGARCGLSLGPRFRLRLRLGRFAPSLLALLIHEPGPERALGSVLIVRSAQELQAVHARPTASRARAHVAERA